MASLSPQFVLETGVYARDLDAAEHFYGTVLGLDVLLREEGRHVFFRCGLGAVLVFNPDETNQGRTLPAHGPDGDGHVAFAVETEQLAEWRWHLNRHDIPVEHEEDWGDGKRSLYVRDPAGNSIEFASEVLWGTAGRDERLRQVRPVLDLDTTESTPVEQFQNETLRPILKLLNPTILRLVAARLARYGVGFAEMDRVDQRDRLRNLMTEDERLKRTLLGMVVGHLTEDELSFYLAHKDEVRRRCVPMLLARAQDQRDVIADHVAARTTNET
jgi:catechol 2,3-dioxygenase-like lactoylglutathione lyase family enzyme